MNQCSQDAGQVASSRRRGALSQVGSEVCALFVVQRSSAALLTASRMHCDSQPNVTRCVMQYAQKQMFSATPSDLSPCITSIALRDIHDACTYVRISPFFSYAGARRAKAYSSIGRYLCIDA